MTTLRVGLTTICQTESSVRPRQSPRSDSSRPMRQADSPRPIRDSATWPYLADLFQLVERPGPTPMPTIDRKLNRLGGTPLTLHDQSISKSTSPPSMGKTQPFAFSQTHSLTPTAQSLAIRVLLLPCPTISSCSHTNRVNYSHSLNLQKIRRSSPT